MPSGDDQSAAEGPTDFCALHQKLESGSLQLLIVSQVVQLVSL